MGIPGFFGWLLKKYRKGTITTNNINNKVDELYIDANCMLHPSCFKILHNSPTDISNEELEKNMINNCISDLDNLINYVSPAVKIFIAVDGVAPMAKIKQQRIRRYKSISDNMLKQGIKDKYGIIENCNWSNASITPGTVFMEKLHLRIKEYIGTISNNINVKYSSYHDAGEGEHKIIEYIRENKTQNEKITRVIYGLDADLIFLSMACDCKNLFLIREEFDMPDASTVQQYNYVSIDTLNKCFTEQIEEHIMKIAYDNGMTNKIMTNTINDVIFICYFLGNDFIPRIPTINIKKYGLEMLLSAYATTYVNYWSPLVDGKNITIDIRFLDDFLFQLAAIERDWMESYNDDTQRREPVFDTDYEREIWKLDNMKIIKPKDVFQKYIGTFDDWKFKYYAHHIGCTDSQDQTIKSICQNYLDGLMWVTQYYFGKCKSWDWSYHYSHSPFICDLSKFIKNNQYNINYTKFEETKPLEPKTQLLCVIPPQLNYLLPESYRKLMDYKTSDIAYMFPSNFELDVYNNELLWQCIPKLPDIDINRIKEAIKNIK